MDYQGEREAPAQGAEGAQVPRAEVAAQGLGAAGAAVQGVQAPAALGLGLGAWAPASPWASLRPR